MKYGNEGMDCKKYFLLFLGKVWLAALAALLGGRELSLFFGHSRRLLFVFRFLFK